MLAALRLGAGRSLAAALGGGIAPAAAAAPAAVGGWVATAAAAAAFHSARPLLSSLQVKIPALGESISDGTVATVLKQAGERVEEDEAILQARRASTAGVPVCWSLARCTALSCGC